LSSSFETSVDRSIKICRYSPVSNVKHDGISLTTRH
jgi:hypothetical protein